MSTPPNIPPGAGAPPPIPPYYDPKAQWRSSREQQKAAGRMQREAWKAQRRAIKDSYTNAYGPRVPSLVGPVILIGIGVVALLLLSGHMNAAQFWSWYAKWWPLMLIGAGLALLGEWALDLRRAVPVRRGGSFVGLIILLAIIGFGASGWNHARPWFSQWGDNDWEPNGDFFNAFGLPEHAIDQTLPSQQIPANAVIDIENPRGDVSVTAGDGATIEVQAHEVAYADSDADAKKIFESETPHLTVSGNAVLLKSEQGSSGRLNLTITVPKSARVTINSGKGDVTAANLGAGINVTAHGDVHLSEIAGSVQARFSNGNHDFSAHDLQGDVTLDGNVNDLTFSEVKGKITQNGEIQGDVHMENVHGPIHLHTSVTELEVAELPGDLTMDSDDLRINEARGQVRVTTHSKDIDLSQIYGEINVETRDGRISIEPAGVYNVSAKNGKGDVELTLPPNASALVNVRTHNGDILSDYPVPSTDGENKQANFTIGSGSVRIVLSADNGDVSIKKGAGFAPGTPSTTPDHRGASNSGAPHLKTPKALPPHPVTQ